MDWKDLVWVADFNFDISDDGKVINPQWGEMELLEKRQKRLSRQKKLKHILKKTNDK
jgi:hypothetical protein